MEKTSGTGKAFRKTATRFLKGVYISVTSLGLGAILDKSVDFNNNSVNLSLSLTFPAVALLVALIVALCLNSAGADSD